MYAPSPSLLPREHVLRPACAALLAMLLISTLLGLSQRLAPAPDAGAAPTAQLPLTFVPNVGQRSPLVKMEARAPGGTLVFMSNGVALSPAPDTTLRVEFAGANAAPAIRGVDTLPGVMNYYGGADAGRWRSNVPTYAGMVYENLYDGITLRYDGSSTFLKGTYTVAPGADSARIRWQYQGAEHVRIDPVSGDLQIAIGGQTLVERAPIAWQEIDGQRVPVAVRYTQSGDMLGFALGSYNSALPLTIDPELVFGTYLGGSSSEYGRAIALDASGNVYVAGDTFSSDFLGSELTLGGSKDVIMLKLNPSGTELVHGTVIGGSSADEGLGIAVNAAGEAFVTVDAESDNFPIQNALFPNRPDTGDGALLKFSASGELLFSTFLGFDVNNSSGGQHVAVDRQGNVYVTGESYIAVRRSRQITLLKLNGSGTEALLNQKLGEEGAQGYGEAVAVSADGKIYLTGTANGLFNDFPVTPDAIQPLCGRRAEFGPNSDCDDDAYVAVLSPEGEILYATYLGGASGENGRGIAVDAEGNILITGNTGSPKFPTVNALQPTCPIEAPTDGCYYDTFVTKLKADGSGFIYSTFLNSNERDSMDFATGIGVDAAGNAYVAGFTEGTKFPIKDAVQDTLGGGNCSGTFTRFCFDAYITKFAPDGKLVYSTYLGGRGDEYTGGIAVDTAGNAHIIGYSGSANFPVTSGALQPKAAPGYEFFVAKVGSRSAGPVIDRPFRTFVPMSRR